MTASVEPAALAALVPITLLGAMVYGLTGFGSALVTIPLASHFVPLPFAIATFALIDLASSLRVGLEQPARVVRAEFLRLAPGILVGVAIGATALVNLPRKAGMAALGVFVIAYALYALARGPGGRPVRAAWGYVAGFAGGITGTLFGAGGPPYAVYLSHRGLSKEQFRATISMTILVSLLMRLAAFAAIGLLWEARVWVAAAVCIPAGMLGIALATTLFRRLSREAVARAVALLLLATGLSLVIRALA